jgi:hypothetical protein
MGLLRNPQTTKPNRLIAFAYLNQNESNCLTKGHDILTGSEKRSLLR